MYRINPLPRKVLITTDEVIKLAPIQDNADPRNLQSAIIVAEDRFIRPGIGREFYEAFRNAKNVVVTADNKATLQSKFPNAVILQEGQFVNALELVENEMYKQLWNEHLWIMLAECVAFIATPTNYSKHTAQGEMNNNPNGIMGAGGAASVGLKEVQWKLDQMLMNRIDPLKAAMHEWICENKADFPLYKKDCGCDSSGGISTARKSAWINVYDDHKRDSECC